VPAQPARPLAPVETISAAHSQGFTLALASESEATCDLEAIVSRSEAEWHGVLGDDCMRLAQQIAAENEETFDSSATRLWSAREALKKLGRPASAPLILPVAASLKSAAQNGVEAGWLLLRSGNYTIATYVAAIRDLRHPVAIAVALEHSPDTVSHSAAI